LEGDQLVNTAELAGFSSHRIGSRNLDMALSGDFDGDGRIELVVPNQAQMELAAIERKNTSAEAEWSLSIGGGLSTNLAAATLHDGKIVLGVGHQGNMLRIWMPKTD
jgi:hypothetical protein